MISEELVVGSFQCNCHILVCPLTGKAAVIDPGDEPQKILNRLEKMRASLLQSSGLPLEVTHLLHTHAHLDHVGATRALRLSFPTAKICLHEKDGFIYDMLVEQGKMFGQKLEAPLPVDYWIEDEEPIRIGSLEFRALSTPGHSPGGLCFEREGKLWSGDTLFQGSIGRTDLWEGDFDVLKKSIQTRLYTLDIDTEVLPGHGPHTKIGIEKKHNPYVRA